MHRGIAILLDARTDLAFISACFAHHAMKKRRGDAIENVSESLLVVKLGIGLADDGAYGVRQDRWTLSAMTYTVTR